MPKPKNRNRDVHDQTPQSKPGVRDQWERRTFRSLTQGCGEMSGEEQIRAAIERLDVVTAPKLMSALKHLIEVWPEARNLFEPSIEIVIRAIKEHQKAERVKWLQA